MTVGRKFQCHARLAPSRYLRVLGEMIGYLGGLGAVSVMGNRLIDLFTDTAAILDSIVSDIYYGCSGGQISMYLPPEHPIIYIWSNRIQNGRRIGKKVYC